MKKSNAINARDSLFATRKMITAGEGENHGGVFDRVYPCFVKMISMRCDNSIECSRMMSLIILIGDFGKFQEFLKILSFKIFIFYNFRNAQKLS